MTGAVSAFGTKLNWDGEDIAEVTSISGPTQKADTIEVTSHDSANAFKEFLAGLVDGGEITFEGNVDTADAAGLIAFNTDMQAREAKTCIITLPSSLGTWTATAIATALEWNYAHDGAMKFSATVKITGKPVLSIS